MEKRSIGSTYRVSDPGVQGRMAVEARINGLKESKRRYAEGVLRSIRSML